MSPYPHTRLITPYDFIVARCLYFINYFFISVKGINLASNFIVLRLYLIKSKYRLIYQFFQNNGKFLFCKKENKSIMSLRN